jgi:hypothetical protein
MLNIVAKTIDGTRHAVHRLGLHAQQVHRQTQGCATSNARELLQLAHHRL